MMSSQSLPLLKCQRSLARVGLVLLLPALAFAQAGIITTVAGNGTIGFSGDGGPATSAQLGSPSRMFGVAVDNQGNLLIVDGGNARIRKVDSSGIIRTIAGGGPAGSGDHGPATGASIFPGGAAVDGAGNLYIAEAAYIQKVDTSGIITTVAGSFAAGYSGDGGPAINAQLFCSDVAADTAGNLYIADILNNRIRKVNTAGIINTIAGTGDMGFSGDGGPATSAMVSSPQGISVDKTGNVYFVDIINGRVRKIDPFGIITTVAGGGSNFLGDGGPATSAFVAPAWTAVDNSGNLYFVSGNNIKKVNTAGIITTAAGSGIAPGFAGDGGPATSATLFAPTGVAVDAAGNIFIADGFNYRVRKVSSGVQGVAFTLVPSTLSFSYTAGGKVPPSQSVTVSTEATLSIAASASTNAGGSWLSVNPANGSTPLLMLTISVNPAGLAPATYSGTITVTPGGAGNPPQTIAVTLVVSGPAPANLITTVVGGGLDVNPGDTGPATSAALLGPTGIAVDGSGNLYFSENGTNRVRKVNSAGTISLLAGNGNFSFAGDGGAAPDASFFGPSGLAVDSAGNLLIADSSNNRVRKVTPAGTVSTLAGNGSVGSSGDGGPAANAPVSTPFGVAVDGAGDVYIATSADGRIRKVNAAGNISTVAGGAILPTNVGDGGPAVGAGLFVPTGVTVDGAGNIYIVDSNNYRIRKVSTSGAISTVAGSGVKGFSGDDGPASAAQINPSAAIGLVVDSAGNLYFADAGNHRVRMVNTAGVISTLAGNGLPSFTGDGGPASAAGLNNPTGLALDNASNLYIADTTNSRIRKVALEAPLPGTPVIFASGVVNGASFQPGVVANSWVTVQGSNLSPTTDTWVKAIVGGRLPTSLDGVSVSIAGKAAYIDYVSPAQINLLAPDVPSGPVPIVITSPNGTSSTFTATASPYGPAFFTWPASQVVATRQDFSLAAKDGTFPGSTTVAAKPGDVLILWGTGFGPTIPAAPPGVQVPADQTYSTSTPPTVTINGATAVVYGAALAPGFAGLYQVAIQVPGTLADGDWPVQVSIGGVPSAGGMVLSVKR